VNSGLFEIQVTAATRILLQNGTRGILANITPGDTINVTGFVSNGIIQANTIRDKSKPAAAGNGTSTGGTVTTPGTPLANLQAIITQLQAIINQLSLIVTGQPIANTNTNSSVNVNVNASSGNTSANNSSSSTVNNSAGGMTISIANFAFNPNTITIRQGETVTWVNNDTVAHTVTSDTGLFDSGSIQPGRTYSYTFPNTGTFNYHCTIHPNMAHASVIVTNSGSSTTNGASNLNTNSNANTSVNSNTNANTNSSANMNMSTLGGGTSGVTGGSGY